MWAPCLEGPDRYGDTMVEAGRNRPAYMRSCLRNENVGVNANVLDVRPGSIASGGGSHNSCTRTISSESTWSNAVSGEGVVASNAVCRI